MPDSNTRFLISKRHVRGQIVKLERSYLETLANGQYTDKVAQLLGQALAAVSALGSIVKLEGSIILQVQSNGAVNTLVAQSNSVGEIRGLAHYDAALTKVDQKLIGEGRLVMTIDGEGSQRYQGIVEIEGASLSDQLKAYFRQSEQLQTHIFLAANAHQAACFLLQQLPSDDAKTAEDNWNHLQILSETLSDEELLSLDVEQILHRLFHEEEVQLFKPSELKFQCRCSREKIEPVIIEMGFSEAMTLVEEQGEIKADCEFCNRSHRFDRVDVAALFESAQSAPPTPQ